MRRGERTYQLIRELEDNTYVFEDRVTGRPWTATRTELWRALEAGELTELIPGPKYNDRAGAEVPKPIQSWTSISEKYRKEIERKLTYVRQALRSGLSRGMRAGVRALIAEVADRINDPLPPRESAVMEWMRRYDEGGRTPLSLMSGYALRQGKRRISDPILAICRDTLAGHYASKKRPTLKDTQSVAQRRVDAQVRAGLLPVEQAKVNYGLIRRLKLEISPYALDVARYGSAYASNHWRYSKSGPGFTRALQRYEVDHTVLDVVVICDRTGMPLGRPTLTVVVDAYSGYVVGWFLSFWGTGLAASFCALRVAIAPKQDLRGLAQGPSHEWLGYGLPEEFGLDNGLEFHSPQFRTMAHYLGVDLFFCPVRQPWLKPTVERCLGKILNILPSEGRVYKRLPNELPERPDRTAAVTFSHLARGLLIAFCDVHPFEINQRRLARPYDLYADSLASLPPAPLPVGTQDLEIIVSPSRTLTVGNEGVVMEYLRFNSDELQDIRRSTGHRFRAQIKLNPESLDYVWVQPPGTNDWLQVPSCQREYTRDLSIVQHRAIRRHMKAELARKGAVETLERGRQQLADMWNTSAVRGRRLAGNHLRALAGFTSNRALRSCSADVTTRDTVPSRFLCIEEMTPEKREIPVFDSFVM